MTTTALVCSLPAAVRIRQLRDAGQSDRLIRVRADLTPVQFRRARTAQPSSPGPIARLLALPAPLTYDPDEQFPVLGVRRRLRALVAIGWPTEVLADALDFDDRTMRRYLSPNTRTLPLGHHHLVCALYDQRWNWTPEDHGVSIEAAGEARALAEQRRYPSALAWDDDRIDNVKANPNRGHGRADLAILDVAAALRVLEGEVVRTEDVQTRYAAIEHGMRVRGLDIETIADAIGMKHESAKRAWERIKKRARAEGFDWPDRPRWRSDESSAVGWERRRMAAS